MWFGWRGDAGMLHVARARSLHRPPKVAGMDAFFRCGYKSAPPCIDRLLDRIVLSSCQNMASAPCSTCSGSCRPSVLLCGLCTTHTSSRTWRNRRLHKHLQLSRCQFFNILARHYRSMLYRVNQLSPPKTVLEPHRESSNAQPGLCAKVPVRGTSQFSP